jgi:aspartyl-tRNA(Asn)/glutamyl-tRNA(Gln) amidotransferase subunit C
MADMTTAISRDEVLHLAQLSNLQLSDDEVAGLQTDLGNILQYVQQLGELDTTGVEPTYQVTDLENVMREDVVQPHDANREALLALSPDQEKNQIKVPKVL